MSTLIGVFLFTIPLIVMAGNDDMAALPQTAWLQVAVPLLWMAQLVTRGAPDLRPGSGLLGPLMVLLSWSAMSLLWATDTFAAERVLFLWLAAAGLALLIATTRGSAVQARLMLMALFWASVAVSVLGLLQHLGGFSGIPQAFPPAGTLGNKNVAAAFVAVMAPVGIAACANANRWASLVAMSMGIALAFVFHTGCRAAGVALLVQLAAALCLIPVRDLARRVTVSALRAPAAGALVFVLLASMPPAESSSVSGSAAELLAGTARSMLRFFNRAPGAGPPAAPPEERAERSVAIRLGVWRNSLEMIRSTPLIGVGLGNFAVHYPRFANSAGPDGTLIDERVESAHNDYVQFVAELGLVGAGLLLWLASVVGRSVFKALRDLRGEDRSFGVAGASGLLGLLVVGGLSATVTQPIALVVAATLVGVTFKPGLRAAEMKPMGLRLAVLGAAAVSLVASLWGMAQIRADRHVLMMAYAEAREDWPAAVEEGLSARRLSPRRTDPRFGTASAMLRLGRSREAAQMLEELTAVEPFNANALGNLGIAYEVGGEPRRAAACFERVLRLRPDDRLARAGLERNSVAR